MTGFRLLKQTRQSTEYSCGASALQTVLKYWGLELDEAELMRRLNTNPEVGTYPEDIVRVARELGLHAEVKDNLSLDEIERATSEGPVIILGQAWRSRQDSDAAVEDDWENGHYVVVLGVDQEYVYFEDPYVRMGKGFLPRQAFEAHWHNIMGGALAKSAKQIRLGIVTRGEKKAQAQMGETFDLSKLNLEKIGSLNLLVTQFEGALLPYDFVNELKGLWEAGILRPDAFIFLRKDQDGNVSAMEGGRLQEGDEIIEINALFGALAGLAEGGPALARVKAQTAATAAAQGDFGLSVADIERIAGKLPNAHSAVIVLFENLWERTFKTIAKKYQGVVIDQRTISPLSLYQLISGDSQASKPASTVEGQGT